MAFQAVPDAAEIVIEWSGNSKITKNVLAAVKPGGYNLADLTVLADLVDLNIGVSWLAEATNEINYVQTIVRGLAFENDQEVIVNTTAGPGELVSEALPGNVTFSIKKTSGLTGRSARGRIYIIGLADSQLAPNENQLTQAVVDALVFNVESMRGSISGSVWTAAIVSRFSNGLKRDPGTVFTWTGSSAVNNNIDSQRRRLIR